MLQLCFGDAELYNNTERAWGHRTMLEQFLVTQLFAFLLIFCRIGACLMVLPGFGETYVSLRTRLLLALMFSLALTPPLFSLMPKIPDSPAGLLVLIVAETLVGVAIGLVCRLIVSAMHIAGIIISNNASLALATQLDPMQATQGSLIGTFLSMSAVLLIFALDLHYVMLRGAVDSYTLFAPGNFPPVGDLALYFSELVADIFTLGFRLAAPGSVVALLMYLGAGILSRLMPNMQVFFVILPPQIFIALFILLAVYSAMMLEFADFFAEHFQAFLEGPAG